MIEKVIIKRTLKAGKTVWEEGAVLKAPLPPDILEEIRLNTGTVGVIEGDLRPKSKLVFVAERVKESASSMTTMATKPTPIVERKPKLKLNRRRK